jgi:penicillin G amidase
MPKQFIDFGFEPEPWTAYDVAMIYVGTMINRFGDLNSELDNLYILQTLIGLHGEETAWDIFDQLIPTVTPKERRQQFRRESGTSQMMGKGKGLRMG